MIHGIHHVLIETHDWDASVTFWKALGYQVAEEHGSAGILHARGGGPYLYVAQVPRDREPKMELVFDIRDADHFDPDVEVVKPLEPTHWGTRLMTVRDPEGREVLLQDAGGA